MLCPTCGREIVPGDAYTPPGWTAHWHLEVDDDLAILEPATTPS